MIAGFTYVEEFLSADEEVALLAHVSAEPFAPIPVRGRKTRRQIVSYGLEFRPHVGRLSVAPPLPSYLHPIRSRAAAIVGMQDSAFEQSLITKYPPKSDIGWHVDHQSFGEVVVAISLLGEGVLSLRRESEEHSFSIRPRSLYALRDDARATFQHRLTATSLRYSITLRPVAPA